MRGNSRQLAANDADELTARRQILFDPQKFLHSERIGDIVRQRGKIIQPIRVRDELGVSHVLGDFFIAAMQEADIRCRFGDDLAVQLEDDAQDSMRRRMG